MLFPRRDNAMHILLVDDDEKIRSALERFLTARGHGLTTAAGGVEALRILEAQQPDLVLCDIQMPGMNGLLFLRAAQLLCPHLPVVLMTANRDVESATAAFRSAAAGYLKKPIDTQELLACIHRVNLHRRREKGGERQSFEPAPNVR